MLKNNIDLDFPFLMNLELDQNNQTLINDVIISNGFLENYEKTFEIDYIKFKMIVK